MRLRKRHVMQWMGVLNDMRRHQSHVIFTCSCGTWDEVDVEVMIRILGEDGSPWDRRPPCENPACDRLTHFMASPGRRTPVRPLIVRRASWTICRLRRAWAAGREDLS